MGNNVEVQILNFEGFPMYPGNLSSFNVSMGNYPMVVPDYLGYCRFENVQTPYNILITRGYTFYCYKDLNIRNPKIVLGSYDGPNTRKFSLPVKFPLIEPEKYGYVRFISKDMLSQDYGSYFLIDENYNSTNILVEIPADRELISGKLIFMQCNATEHYALNVWEYFNFGIKDVTIHAGNNDTVAFSQNDIEFNPEEKNVDVNVTIPEPYTANLLRFYISFPGYSNTSDIMLGYYRDLSLNITQTVPASLNIPFNIKVESSYWSYDHYSPYDFRSRKIINMQPGQNTDIQHEKLSLLSPQNNEEGITSNSVLKAEDTGDKGVFLFSIGLRADTLEQSAYIFTDKNELRLNDIVFNLRLVPNTWYMWSAGKYSTFNSIDEFVSEPYVIRENFNTFRFSGKRYFKTAP